MILIFFLFLARMIKKMSRRKHTPPSIQASFPFGDIAKSIRASGTWEETRQREAGKESRGLFFSPPLPLPLPSPPLPSPLARSPKWRACSQAIYALVEGPIFIPYESPYNS